MQGKVIGSSELPFRVSPRLFEESGELGEATVGVATKWAFHKLVAVVLTDRTAFGGSGI